MRGSTWLAAAVAVGSISTGVAVAGGWGAETTGVTGDFTASPKGSPKERNCDANHVKVRQRFEGSQDSSDRRLRGDIEIDAESVVSTENGLGRTEGTVVIRKEGRHHRAKFRGEFIGVIEPDGGAEGFITGETKGRHRSAHLFANFNAEQDAETGVLTGEFGKDSQPGTSYYDLEDQDPAVLTNACFDRKHDHDHGHGHGHGHGNGNGHHNGHGGH
jgi:hypothetical protein